MSNRAHRQWIERMKQSDHVMTSYEEMNDYVANSTAIYKGKPVDFLYGAKWFSKAEIEDINEKTTMMYGILQKIIRHYKNDADYRKLFPFNETLEQLILKEHGYNNELPIARIDFFYDEIKNSMKWCEFNADGTSAMNEDRELVTGLSTSSLFKEFVDGRSYYSFELFESWIDKMLEIYDDFSSGKQAKTIAIVDFLEKGSPTEFEIFRQKIEARGVKCVIADIRDLRFADDQLKVDDQGIDIVYRRAVTSDIMDYYNDIPDFIEMVHSEKVCLIGPMSTQIIHHKLIFNIMRLPVSLSLLTDEEKKFVYDTVPETYKVDELSKQEMSAIIHDKDKWIVKPYDRYGSKGVVAGVDVSDEEWEKTMLSIIEQGYIVQAFCEPYKHEYPLMKENKFEYHSFRNITGAFMYAGEFKGILSRVGPNGVISGINGGFSQPTIVIE